MTTRPLIRLFIGGLLLGSCCGVFGFVSEAQASQTATSQPTQKRFIWNAKQAERFARLSLHCTATPYPYKLGQVLGSKRDLQTPQTLHPAFYGCFDWHSAVHGHWSMVRLLKRFPTMSLGPAIRKRLQAHLTLAHIKKEAAFFRSKYHTTFERPYGWGWFLRLVGELHTWNDKQAQGWRKNLQPLEQLLVKRTHRYLKKLSVPVRAGTHNSTAYALVHIFDYATATGNKALLVAIHKASRRYFLKDTKCPAAYEPSGEDFISPCLIEADLLRRVLPEKAFRRWFRRFLPAGQPKALRPILYPPQIRDKKDYKIGHLIGLSLQRAGALRGIASQLPKGTQRKRFQEAAKRHLRTALKQMFESGYGGTHWLASFAIYTLTEVGVSGNKR